MENEFSKHPPADWLTLMGYNRDRAVNVNDAHKYYKRVLHAKITPEDEAYDWLVDLGLVGTEIDVDLAIRIGLTAAMMQLADADDLIDREEYIQFKDVLDTIPASRISEDQALEEYWAARPKSMAEFSRVLMSNIASGDLRVLGIQIFEDVPRDVDQPPYWPDNLREISKPGGWSCTVVVPIKNSDAIETISSKTSARVYGSGDLAYCEFDREELDRIAMIDDASLRDTLATALAQSLKLTKELGIDVNPCPNLWAAVEACL